MTSWLNGQTSPELLYLETKWASLIPYAKVAELLKDVLPLDEQLNAVTIRNHLLEVAERSEAELEPEQVSFIEGCPAAWEDKAGRSKRPAVYGAL